jgi:hypothetical protein
MDTIDRDETSAKPAAKQRADDKKILRARPVKGEIDHAALTRKIIARFPKILDALAK